MKPSPVVRIEASLSDNLMDAVVDDGGEMALRTFQKMARIPVTGMSRDRMVVYGRVLESCNSAFGIL